MTTKKQTGWVKNLNRLLAELTATAKYTAAGIGYTPANNIGGMADTAGTRKFNVNNVSKALQEEENFIKTSALSSVHASGPSWYIKSALVGTDFTNLFTPGGSLWVDADRKMTIKNAIWDVNMTSSNKFMTLLVLSVTSSGTNPSDTEVTSFSAYSVEEVLDSVFTNGEHDFLVLSEPMQSHYGVTYWNGSAAAAVYYCELSIPIRDIIARYLKDIESDNRVDVKPSLWLVTFATQNITIATVSTISVRGRIDLRRNNLLSE